MSQQRPFIPRPALAIPPGNAVRRSADPAVLCLKGQRKAKSYVQDYVVAVAPAAAGGPRLEFVDPETELMDGGQPLRFVPGAAAAGDGGTLPHPRPGDLVLTERGLWLAVSETSGLFTFVSFIKVATGEVRRLREGHIRAVYRDWRIEDSLAS